MTNTKQAPQQPDPKLLELLVCPVTKGALVYDKKAAELVSPSAGLAYPIKDGIPVMLEGEARQLSADEKKAHTKKQPKS